MGAGRYHCPLDCKLHVNKTWDALGPRKGKLRDIQSAAGQYWGVGARVRDTLYVQPAEGKGEACVSHPGGVRGTGLRASTAKGGVELSSWIYP